MYPYSSPVSRHLCRRHLAPHRTWYLRTYTHQSRFYSFQIQERLPKDAPPPPFGHKWPILLVHTRCDNYEFHPGSLAPQKKKRWVLFRPFDPRQSSSVGCNLNLWIWLFWKLTIVGHIIFSVPEPVHVSFRLYILYVTNLIKVRHIWFRTRSNDGDTTERSTLRNSSRVRFKLLW